MNPVRPAHPISDDDAVRYWASDLPAGEAEAVEEHMFECADCCARLTEISELTRCIVEVARAGRFSSVVTEAVLNRLARDGVRMRTFVLDPESYRRAATKMAGLANELRAAHGIKLSFIDMGGGFASHNTLRAQYLPGEQATPSFDRYAEAICDGLSALDVPPREMPTLVLETGRALVDDAGFLISTVEAAKRLPDGRQSLVVDAGVNVLFTSFWYKHDVVPAQEFPAMLEPTVIYGPLCMAIDEVRETLQFPAVSAGERLVFKNVGAYNVTQWMQFITLRPAVVMIGDGGKVATLRRAENLSDFTSIEEIPEWMR